MTIQGRSLPATVAGGPCADLEAASQVGYPPTWCGARAYPTSVFRSRSRAMRAAARARRTGAKVRLLSHPIGYRIALR